VYNYIRNLLKGTMQEFRLLNLGLIFSGIAGARKKE
jgi:hypothetical protein